MFTNYRLFLSVTPCKAGKYPNKSLNSLCFCVIRPPFCRLGHVGHGNLHHIRQISQGGLLGINSILPPCNPGILSSTKQNCLSLTLLLLTNMSLPFSNSAPFFFPLMCMLVLTEPYMCYSAGTHFPAENFVCCCKHAYCVRRRRMSFHSVKEFEVSGDHFLDNSDCSLAFATGSGIHDPPFSADKLVDMKWVFF